MKSPLPMRDGVNATRVRLPESGEWGTALGYLLARFRHVDPEGIAERFDRGEVQGIGGVKLTRDTPLGEHTFIWYYRELPEEQPLPVDITVLHRDDHLLVADKPHFLPTTPGGMYVKESALVRLRASLNLPDLVPIHRLDRMTAGVLLFSLNPDSRGDYQQLFERRLVSKSYEAVARFDPTQSFPQTVRNRLVKTKDYLLSRELEGEPNAESLIDLAHTDGTHALYRLYPHTGKTHQLRQHMGKLGLGILNDRYYPTLLDEAPDNYAEPLQLLAKSITFTDPLSGETRTFTSELTLKHTPAAQQQQQPQQANR